MGHVSGARQATPWPQWLAAVAPIGVTLVCTVGCGAQGTEPPPAAGAPADTDLGAGTLSDAASEGGGADSVAADGGAGANGDVADGTDAAAGVDANADGTADVGDGTGDGTADASAAVACPSGLCDDNNACTLDRCVGGICESSATALCASGAVRKRRFWRRQSIRDRSRCPHFLGSPVWAALAPRDGQACDMVKCGERLRIEPAGAAGCRLAAPVERRTQAVGEPTRRSRLVCGDAAKHEGLEAGHLGRLDVHARMGTRVESKRAWGNLDDPRHALACRVLGIGFFGRLSSVTH